MNLEKAFGILELHHAKYQILSRKLIDNAYRKQCRRYHPDSRTFCVAASLSTEQIGCKMRELQEAREYLLKYNCDTKEDTIDTNALWNEEKQEWVDLATSIWSSGCLWDDKVELPMERIVSLVTTSSFVDQMLTNMQDYCVKEIKKSHSTTA